MPMANRHLKRCSFSLFLREIQIKTIGRHHYPLIKILKVENGADTNYGEN